MEEENLPKEDIILAVVPIEYTTKDNETVALPVRGQSNSIDRQEPLTPPTDDSSHGGSEEIEPLLFQDYKITNDAPKMYPVHDATNHKASSTIIPEPQAQWVTENSIPAILAPEPLANLDIVGNSLDDDSISPLTTTMPSFYTPQTSTTTNNPVIASYRSLETPAPHGFRHPQSSPSFNTFPPQNYAGAELIDWGEYETCNRSGN
ncbi:hypothetical protein ABW20_dc0106498 [Dactylellina cionopaga]|nr:hypothetical protein ABW20_dc0106498 [Dactylellina cionopaga]